MSEEAQRLSEALAARERSRFTLAGAGKAIQRGLRSPGAKKRRAVTKAQKASRKRNRRRG